MSGFAATHGRAIRVLLADDHALIRAALRDDLADAGFEICAEAEDAAGAVSAALTSKPDVCLLDIEMPGGGITAAWEITSARPGACVAMLSVCRDDEILFAAVRAGASGCLLKDEDPERLAEGVRRIAEGELVLPHAVQARVHEETGADHGVELAEVLSRVRANALGGSPRLAR